MNQILTASERLETVLNGNRGDRLPCICPGGMMNMLTAELMELADAYWPDAHTDPAVMAKLAGAVYANGLFDNIGVPFCMTVEAEAMGAKTHLGDVYTEPRVTEYAISSVENRTSLKSLDMNSGRVKTVLDAIELVKQQHLEAAVIGNLTGPISTASSVADANFFYRELRKKKEDAHSGRKAEKGFHLTTGCDIPDGTSIEKMDWFMEAARLYGKAN